MMRNRVSPMPRCGMTVRAGMFQTHRRCRGFTLIETMVSLALTTLLFGSATYVMTATLRYAADQRAAAQDGRTFERLITDIRRQTAGASTIRPGGASIQIIAPEQSAHATYRFDADQVYAQFGLNEARMERYRFSKHHRVSIELSGSDCRLMIKRNSDAGPGRVLRRSWIGQIEPDESDDGAELDDGESSS